MYIYIYIFGQYWSIFVRTCLFYGFINKLNDFCMFGTHTPTKLTVMTLEPFHFWLICAIQWLYNCIYDSDLGF